MDQRKSQAAFDGRCKKGISIERIFDLMTFYFQFKTKINSEGFLIIKSDMTRYQQMNLADALEKLRTMIRDAEKPKTIELSPEKLERIRKG